MLQFLLGNGTLIFFGIALLFMFYMHSGRGHSMGGGGGGCGMGHQQGEHAEHASSQSETKPVEPPLEKWGSVEKETPTPVATGADHGGHGGGCH